MTREQAVAAIREKVPEAQLGKTAQEGPSGYWERAKDLDFQMHDDEGLQYRADKANGGNPMWIYLGKDNKVYCGDKSWSD